MMGLHILSRLNATLY